MRSVERHGAEWLVDEPHTAGYQFWDDWENAEWEQRTLDIVDEFVTPGSTVVDIGAWIGPVSLWAAHRGARVIAIEPDKVALHHLQANVKANAASVSGSIEVVAGAISDHTGSCFVVPHPEGWGSSMTRLSAQPLPNCESQMVSCWTLPQLFEEYHVENCSLVKMDIEGGEGLILEHVAPFLAELEIPLWVAMHEGWWIRQVDRKWFDGFTVYGDLTGWGESLAVPKSWELRD